MENTVFLNTNREMPLLGLGVYKATGENEAENSIISAVESGYRLIDTASAYKNEENVGRGIARCGVSRGELFVTTKVWNTAQRIGDIQGAFDRSLERLKLDYVDLYLIHWPVPGCYLSTWKELEKIQQSGRALSIGVSNFEIRHLEELAKISNVVPAVNQIECHPLCYPKELIDYCQSRGIQIQAYAPLANTVKLLLRSDFAGLYRKVSLLSPNPVTLTGSKVTARFLILLLNRKIWIFLTLSTRIFTAPISRKTLEM